MHDVSKSKRCTRSARSGNGYCIFHTNLDDVSKKAHVFYSDIRKLISEKDGDWRGFIFPSNLRDIFINEETIDFKIDLSSAFLNDQNLTKINFEEEFTIIGAEIHGEFLLEGCTFKKVVNFSKSVFYKPLYVKSSKFHSLTIFIGCRFKDIVSFTGAFYGACQFNEGIFEDSAKFRGQRNVTVSVKSGNFSIGNKSLDGKIGIKKFLVNSIAWLNEHINSLFQKISRYLLFISVGKASSDSVDENLLFYEKVHFESAEFRRPENVNFWHVDLSNAYFNGTDLRGVRYQDVKWWQDSLNRNGLFEEVFLLESKDRSFWKYGLKRLEESYRNTRLSLEKNKDFLLAADFYVGELDARRKRKNLFSRSLYSIEAIYRAVSNYGADTLRSVRIFGELTILHASIIWLYLPDTKSEKYLNLTFHSSISSLDSMIETFSILWTNSLKVLTLQRGGLFIEIGGIQNIIDAVFRILGPIVIALIVLSFRGRIKRF